QARLHRRSFMERVAETFLGVSVVPVLGSVARAADEDAAATGGKARQVIYLFLKGGLSHLDTFDVKTGKGEAEPIVDPIQSSVPGMVFGADLPDFATHADKLAVVRSLSTETGDH